MDQFLRNRSSSVLKSLNVGPLKVSVIGSGNWGCVAAKIIATNAHKSYIFNPTVHMWVNEEIVNDRKLTDIINNEHENVKYLPNVKLPENLIASSDLAECVKDAVLLVFVLPHQFVYSVLQRIKACKTTFKYAKAISLLKGLHVTGNGSPYLYSQLIQQELGIECSVLSGANVAKDVSREEFSEATVGYKDKESAELWQLLFHTKYFRVNCIPDVHGVEVCGAIKNVIALSAGFCDGMGLGTNTKSAIIRIGIEELKKFAVLFFDGVIEETFFDSAGFADVITTCFGGRNVKCAAEFVIQKGKKSWDQIEQELLEGQKLQGPLTAKEIYKVLENKSLLELFPLLVTTYQVAFEGAPPRKIIDVFQDNDSTTIRLLEECNPCIVYPMLAPIKSKLKSKGSSFNSENQDPERNH